MAESSFAVLLKTEPIAVAMPLAEALAKFDGVPVQDTIRVARHSWGIVKENLDETKAAALVEALAAKSIPAAAAPMSSLAIVPEARVGDKIEATDQGFRIHLSAGETPWLPWNSLSLLCAATFKETHIHTHKEKIGPSAAEKAAKIAITLATGIPMPTTKSREVEIKRETTELNALMDLFLEKPAARLRLKAEKLDANYLGERRVLDSFGNFRLVLQDLAARAPGARRNHGANVFLTGAPLNTMGYDLAQELDREERWLLSTAGLK